MGVVFFASAVYSCLFVIWAYLGLGLLWSSALNLYLLFPLTWIFYKVAVAMRFAGFDDLQAWFIVLALSQAGIFIGLFLALWVANAL